MYLWATEARTVAVNDCTGHNRWGARRTETDNFRDFAGLSQSAEGHLFGGGVEPDGIVNDTAPHVGGRRPRAYRED